jgi:hypothetical protein
VIKASFGTSGTIYGLRGKSLSSIPRERLPLFVIPPIGWLPLLCTMNVTVATEMVREDFGWSHEKYVPLNPVVLLPDPVGCSCCPISKGSELPMSRTALGFWFGVNKKTFEAGHFARAAMEGRDLGHELRAAPSRGAWRSKPTSDSGDAVAAPSQRSGARLWPTCSMPKSSH